MTMIPLHVQIALRFRLLLTRAFASLGFGEHAILLPLALLIGVLSSAAAVSFHELIGFFRDLLYKDLVAEKFLYGWGLSLLILFPAAGGLVVGLFSRYLIKGKEGHGVIDVIETVLRSKGHINPISAIEKIFTSAVTIGSGGSAGAEGPIVQIGAAISSGVGTLLQVGKGQLPVLIGCGTAAGISAIFGSPIGGVLFTLEVILLDFSIRSFTPIAVASVVAYVTTQTIFRFLHGMNHQAAIFTVPIEQIHELTWGGVPSVVLLGIVCGLVGVTLTRAMHRSEELFRKVKIGKAWRPAFGGALLGVLGILYIVCFGWMLLGQPKPISFSDYPMPAFYGDGYGVIQPLISDKATLGVAGANLILLLVFLILAKIVGTCFTLSSGGSGGVIAPSLFLGATTGSLIGHLLPATWSAGIHPGLFALIGMGAVLAGVVHAPLASILILMEVTRQQDLVLPAMLACVTATGMARVVSRDSIYTLGLRTRGVVVGSGTDVSLLRRLSVDSLKLLPAKTISHTAPLLSLLEQVAEGDQDFVVLDDDGMYAGLAVAEDVRTALLQKEAVPFLLVEDLARPELPTFSTTDDLAVVFEAFGRYDTARLGVHLPGQPRRVIGLVSRRELMRRYHEALVAA